MWLIVFFLLESYWYPYFMHIQSTFSFDFEFIIVFNPAPIKSCCLKSLDIQQIKSENFCLKFRWSFQIRETKVKIKFSTLCSYSSVSSQIWRRSRGTHQFLGTSSEGNSCCMQRCKAQECTLTFGLRFPKCQAELWAFLVAQMVKNLPAKWETWV